MLNMLCDKGRGICKASSIAPAMWRFPFRHRDTPSSHPFLDGMFHEINHPAIGVSRKAPCQVAAWKQELHAALQVSHGTAPTHLGWVEGFLNDW